ncbi:MAG TPA: hypothetical protein VNM48_10645 [Chloroflexota bacterium]|nr:hypothetical protein [Chloroflexota bacterium]
MSGPTVPYHGGAAKRAATVEPRKDEVRLTWPGGLLIVRGRLAWLLKKLAIEGGAQLAEDLDRLDNGHLDIEWTDRGSAKVQTRRTYNWSA